MMSMFSPFDAFFAESNGWKLFNFPSPPLTSAAQFDRKSSPSEVENCSRKEAVTPPVKKDAVNSDGTCRKPMTVTKKRNPRFAVELDGVHCFETILPY